MTTWTDPDLTPDERADLAAILRLDWDSDRLAGQARRVLDRLADGWVKADRIRRTKRRRRKKKETS